MFIVQDVIVDEQIVKEFFACDIEKCKGVCCTIPGAQGAPLDDSELKELELAYPFYKKYLSEKHNQLIEKYGFYEGVIGKHYTLCVDNKECVYVYYENQIAKCSIENAYLNGEINWRKPISCQLFPIRQIKKERICLKYESLDFCIDAKVYGRKIKVHVYEFLKEALISKFGIKWYNELLSVCSQQNKIYENERE